MAGIKGKSGVYQHKSHSEETKRKISESHKGFKKKLILTGVK